MIDAREQAEQAEQELAESRRRRDRIAEDAPKDRQPAQVLRMHLERNGFTELLREAMKRQ
nr:hypothetical protein [Gordonia jinhuaensis]